MGIQNLHIFIILIIFNRVQSKSYLACSESNYPETAKKCAVNVENCNKAVMECQNKEGYVEPGLIKSVNHDPEVYNCIRKAKDVYVNFQNKIMTRCLCEQTQVCNSGERKVLAASLFVIFLLF